MYFALYITLGVANGLLFRWALVAANSYKILVQNNASGRNRLPLLNKLASVMIMPIAGTGSMILMGLDIRDFWINFVLFLAAWGGTVFATRARR